MCEYVCRKELVDIECYSVLPVAIFCFVIGESEHACEIFNVPSELGVESQFYVGTVLAFGLMSFVYTEPCGIELFVVTTDLEVV